MHLFHVLMLSMVWVLSGLLGGAGMEREVFNYVSTQPMTR
jgi:hypothetical protein